MKQLIIIGARAYGRGACDIAKSMSTYGNTFKLKGFLDDNNNALDGYDGYPPIIDSVENYIIQPNDVFACALGDVRYKKKYIQLILDKGGHFFNLIHSKTSIGNNVKFGEGVIVGYGTQIDCDVTIGNYCNIQTNAVIGHDTKVGDWSMIDCFAFTGGFVKLGEGVTLHTRATIIPQICVGDYATVNACSCCIRNVKTGSVMMGNPAKELLIPKLG